MSSASKDDLLFRALADARRRAILDLLRASPRTTGELCEHFARTLDRCTVMQHIGVLESAELIIAHREGRSRWNYLNAAPFKEIHDRWISPYAKAAVDLLARLKRDVESDGHPSPPASPGRQRQRRTPASGPDRVRKGRATGPHTEEDRRPSDPAPAGRRGARARPEPGK